MSQFRWFSALLAALLIGFCWLGNGLRGDPHLVSAFPLALCVLAFPLAIYPALRQRVRVRPCTVGALQRVGWGIVWPASIAFAIFVAAFVGYRFARPSIGGVMFSLAVTLLLSLVVGWLFVNACVLFVQRSVRGDLRAEREPKWCSLTARWTGRFDLSRPLQARNGRASPSRRSARALCRRSKESR